MLDARAPPPFPLLFFIATPAPTKAEEGSASCDTM